MFGRLLSMTGYAVKVASGCKAALTLAEQESFDLLVCDIGLPDGSGLDLMRTVSTQYGLRGIAVSGFGELKDIDDSKAAGFAVHILKPITFDKMKAAIDRAIAADVEG